MKIPWIPILSSLGAAALAGLLALAVCSAVAPHGIHWIPNPHVSLSPCTSMIGCP